MKPRLTYSLHKVVHSGKDAWYVIDNADVIAAGGGGVRWSEYFFDVFSARAALEEVRRRRAAYESAEDALNRLEADLVTKFRLTLDEARQILKDADGYREYSR